MQQPLCDIDKSRPAAHVVRVKQDGKSETLNVCDFHYRQLRRRSNYFSPFESLFRGPGFFEDFFTDRDQIPDDFERLVSDVGYPLSRRQESIDIDEYISEQTKELIEQAGEEAIRSGTREVDTEHLLKAILESNVVGEILNLSNIDKDEIIKSVEKFLKTAKKQRLPTPSGEVEITVSPRVKNALENAFNVSQEMGHGYIGPEHILIGLSEETEGAASDILRQYNLTPQTLRKSTIAIVGRGAEEERTPKVSSTPEADKYSRDLSQLARSGKLDPVIGRSDEITTVIEILSRRTKNNPVLIGDPGVGKTAIVEGLAQRIEAGEVPEVLENKRVLELNINSIVAGSRYRGDFEERIKAIVDEITAHKDELIIFIDEVHTIVGAGGAGGEGGLDVSNVIKPALSRGELHLVGATTLNEYQKYIEKDAALERRFQPVFVSEPTVEQTIEILHGLRDKYEAFHKVKITDEAITAAAELSNRYITNRFLPDKAIDLIDQASSRVRILFTARSTEERNIKDEINKLKREQKYATSHKQFDRAKKLEEQIKDLNNKKEQLEHKAREFRGMTTTEVRAEQIAQIVSKLTGIPVKELTQEEKEKLAHMEEFLHKRVIGQDEAVTAVSDAIRRSRSGLAAAKRPIATFIFLGPTGVGKTELARSLAWFLFGDDDAIVRIDMSEYMERFSVSRLIGAPPGYVGYEEGGQLSEAVRRRPYSIVLLDEIEKAHSDVYNILLQVLDDGRLTDSKGRIVDFTNTVIIATSNLGGGLIQKSLTEKGAVKDYEQLKNSVNDILRVHFKPEFLNRIDEIIVFRALDMTQVKEIVKLQLEKVKKTIEGQGIKIVFDNSVVNYLAKVSFRPEFGAREIRRRIQTDIENLLAKEMISGNIKENDKVKVTYDTKNKKVSIIR